MTASPSLRLFVGLGLSLATIGGFGLYTAHEIRTLRDKQTAISERNRKDSVQLLRIQNNLARLATTMRDMADQVEPYPLVSWRQIFDRLRVDLSQAIALEKTLAPAERPAAQQERLLAAVERFWQRVDEMFRVAAVDERAAIERLRTSVSAQHMELVGMVSQFLVLNNRVQEEAAQENQAIYDRVVREIARPRRSAPDRRRGDVSLHHPGEPPRLRRGRAPVDAAAEPVVADAAAAGGSAAGVRARAPRRVRPDLHSRGHAAGPGHAQPPARIRRSSATSRRSVGSRNRRSRKFASSHGCSTRSSWTTSASRRRSNGSSSSSDGSTASTRASKRRDRLAWCLPNPRFTSTESSRKR